MQMQEFRIEVSQNGGNVQLIHVYGQLDMLTAPKLSEAIQTLDGSSVVFDLSDCSFIDSSGLRVLHLRHHSTNKDRLPLREHPPGLGDRECEPNHAKYTTHSSKR